MNAVPIRLASRNVLRHRLRSTLTLAAVAIGVAGLLVVGGFVQDVYVQLAEATIHSQLGHLQIYRAGYFTSGSRKASEYSITDAASIIAVLRSFPEVQQVMSRQNFSALLNNGRSDFAVIGEGIEPGPERQLGSFVTFVQGRNLADTDRDGIVVGEGVATSLALHVGSNVTLLTNTTDGAMNTADFKVVGVFRSFSRDYDNRAIRISLDAAQDLLDSGAPNALVVMLKETSQTTQAKTKIEGAMRGRDVEVLSWMELSDFYKKTIELYRRQFGILELITMIMVVLSVISSANMSTFERVGEFGTMRALGDRNGDIFRLVVVENIVIGLAGASIGVAIGVLLAIAISEIGIPMPPPPNAESGYTASVQIVGSIIATTFAIGLFATIGAALWPAYRISRVELADALRQNV